MISQSCAFLALYNIKYMYKVIDSRIQVWCVDTFIWPYNESKQKCGPS